MASLAILVAFLSASQDVVIDAYRIEILTPSSRPWRCNDPDRLPDRSAGRGAGALIIAARWGWSRLRDDRGAVSVGISCSFSGLNRRRRQMCGCIPSDTMGRFSRVARDCCDGTVRRLHATADVAAIVIFIVGYKLGEAMAGVMRCRCNVSLGFSLNEIAAVSKLVGFFATVVGAIIGGLLTSKLGVMRALILCGILQSAGNLFYVLQAVGGHRLDYLALCVAAENLTGAMAALLSSPISQTCARPRSPRLSTRCCRRWRRWGARWSRRREECWPTSSAGCRFSS